MKAPCSRLGSLESEPKAEDKILILHIENHILDNLLSYKDDIEQLLNIVANGLWPVFSKAD